MMLLGANSSKWVSPLLIFGAGEEYGEKTGGGGGGKMVRNKKSFFFFFWEGRGGGAF